MNPLFVFALLLPAAFGMLFLSFSFFLIVSALMLVGLLFRLNLERLMRLS